MAKIEWRGGALLAPVPPAMVTCGSMEHPNVLTVAWTGIVNTIPPKTYISVRPRRHSYGLIRESGEFVINLTTEALIPAADYCGIYTGAKVDKFARCGLHPAEVPGFSCPMLAESPLSLACRVTEVIPMGTHDMFLADVVSVHVDEALLDENGKLCLERAHLAAFAHGEYFALGEKLGYFGFTAAKKKKHTAERTKPSAPSHHSAEKPAEKAVSEPQEPSADLVAEAERVRGSAHPSRGPKKRYPKKDRVKKAPGKRGPVKAANRGGHANDANKKKQ